MAPLEAASGDARVSRARPPSMLLRVGVGRGRLRYHPQASGRHWGAFARGADSGDGRLGPSWGAAAPLGTSSGATTGSRWSVSSILAQVDFGRTSRPTGLTGRADFGYCWPLNFVLASRDWD